MPDGEISEAGAVFANQSVTISPSVKRITKGTDTPSTKYYIIENWSGDDRYVTMPTSTVIAITGSGEKSFLPIRINQTGTYYFGIREVESMQGDGPDVAGWELTVTVTKNGSTLQASSLYQSQRFDSENTVAAIFEYSSVKFSPVVKSQFIGDRVCDARFSVKAKGDYAYASVPSPITISGEGIAEFDPIVIEAAGVYEFLIEETSVDSDFIRDERIYTLTLTASEDEGGLNVYSSYSSDYSSGEALAYASFVTIENTIHGWTTATEVKAKRLMGQMTLEEKVGQLFLLHYSDTTARSAEQVKTITNTYHPGGYLILQADLNNETPESFRDKIVQTQKDSKIPLIISIDEEGGKISRASGLSQYRTAPFPDPKTLKNSGGLTAVYNDSIEKAQFLENLGINLNFAPVADTASSGSMVSRVWSENGFENAQYISTVVGAMERAGIGTTLKHFPGYGSTSSKKYFGFNVNTLSKNDFRYNDLLPFYAGMFAGNRAVMITHYMVNCYDQSRPASLSPAIYKLLRNDLGFDGLAITDDLNLDAITSFAGAGKESLTAIKAGADMVLTPNPEEQILPVLEAARSGALSMKRIEEACLRVLCWKISKGLMDDISDIYADEIDVSIPVKVIVDDVPTEVCRIEKVYLDNASKTDSYYFYLNDIASILEKYGLDMDRYVGSLILGQQDSLWSDLSFSQNSIKMIDGEWVYSLSQNTNLNTVSLFLASSPMQPGTYNLVNAPMSCGFYTVRVNDIIAASSSLGYEDVSSVQHIAAGETIDVKLPVRDESVTWIVDWNEESLYSYDMIVQQDMIIVHLKKVYSPVIIASGSKVNVNYTVQYYGNIEVLDKSGAGDKAHSLDIIDTSGGILPQNRIDPSILKLTLNQDGSVKKVKQLKKLYADEAFSFQNASTLIQIDKLMTFDV